MSFFRSLRPSIAAKAMLLILLLAGMSGLANWFCLRVAGRLDQVNHAMAAEVSPALRALAEAKTAVASMGLATYKVVAAAERDAAREAGAEIVTQFALAKNSLNNFVSRSAKPGTPCCEPPRPCSQYMTGYRRPVFS